MGILDRLKRRKRRIRLFAGRVKAPVITELTERDKFLMKGARERRRITRLEVTAEQGVPIIVSPTKLFHKLFLLYRTDPVTRRAIDLWSGMIVTDIVLRHQDQSVIDRYKAWMYDIGFIDLLILMVKHQFITGRSVARIIIDEENRKLRFEILDPTYLEVITTATGEISLDEEGEIVGFKYSYGAKIEEIPRQESFYFSFFSLDHSPFGVSPLETIYKDSTICDNLKAGLGETYYRFGTPLYVFRLGDRDHEWSEDEAERLNLLLGGKRVERSEKARQQEIKEEEEGVTLSERTYLILPYWHQLEVVSPRIPRGMSDPLLIFESEKACGLGLPLAMILTGAVRRGEAVKDQLLLMEREVRRYQRILARAIERQVFPVLHRVLGLDGMPPTVMFQEISAEHLSQCAHRLAKLSKAGLLTPDRDLENELRAREGLPLLPSISAEEDIRQRIHKLEIQMQTLLDRLLGTESTTEE